MCNKLNSTYILISSYALSEDRRRQHALPVFCSLLQEKNGFIVAMGVSSKRSQKTSNFGKNILNNTLGCAVCVYDITLINF